MKLINDKIILWQHHNLTKKTFLCGAHEKCAGIYRIVYCDKTKITIKILQIKDSLEKF